MLLENYLSNMSNMTVVCSTSVVQSSLHNSKQKLDRLSMTSLRITINLDGPSITSNHTLTHNTRKLLVY
jgi:hypothetical protein